MEKRLRQLRRPHCGSVRIDETYVKIRGKWRYLYRAIDKHGNPIDFLLTAKRDLDAALRKGFGFSGGWTVNNQNELLAHLFALQKVNKACKCTGSGDNCRLPKSLRQARFKCAKTFCA